MKFKNESNKPAAGLKSMLWAPLRVMINAVRNFAKRLLSEAGINILLLGGLIVFAIGMALALQPGLFGIVINQLFLGFLPGLGVVLSCISGIMFCLGTTKRVDADVERKNRDFQEEYKNEEANRIAVEQQIRDLKATIGRLQDKLRGAEIHAMANIDRLENIEGMVLGRSNETVVTMKHEEGEEKPRPWLRVIGGKSIRESKVGWISQQMEKNYGVDLDLLKFSVDETAMKIKVYGAVPKHYGVMRGENPAEEMFFTYTERAGSGKGSIDFDQNRILDFKENCRLEHQKRTEQIDAGTSKWIMANFKERLLQMFSPFGFDVEIVSGGSEGSGLLSWKEVFTMVRDVVHENFAVEEACRPEEPGYGRRYAGGLWLGRNPFRWEARRRPRPCLAG